MLKPIPFDVTIPAEERDRTLPAKLAGESAGILNWAPRGCIEWQARGLGQPKEIDDAVNAYRAERWIKLAPFIKGDCVVGSDLRSHQPPARRHDKWCERRRGRQSTPSSARRWSRTSRRFTTGRRATGQPLMIKAGGGDLCNGARGRINNTKKY